MRTIFAREQQPSQVMLETSLVEANSPQDASLDAFNRCVRTKIRAMVEGELGRGSIPYSRVVIMSMPPFWSLSLARRYGRLARLSDKGLIFRFVFCGYDSIFLTTEVFTQTNLV